MGGCITKCYCMGGGGRDELELTDVQTDDPVRRSGKTETNVNESKCVEWLRDLPPQQQREQHVSTAEHILPQHVREDSLPRQGQAPPEGGIGPGWSCAGGNEAIPAVHASESSVKGKDKLQRHAPSAEVVDRPPVLSSEPLPPHPPAPHVPTHPASVSVCHTSPVQPAQPDIAARPATLPTAEVRHANAKGSDQNAIHVVPPHEGPLHPFAGASGQPALKRGGGGSMEGEEKDAPAPDVKEEEGEEEEHDAEPVYVRKLRDNEAHLIDFDLSAHDICDDQVIYVASALLDNTHLRSLDLSGNDIADDGACALADALRCNNTLTALDLRVNAVGDRGGERLAEALASNVSLSSLWLVGNPISENVKSSLCKAWGKRDRSLLHT